MVVTIITVSRWGGNEPPVTQHESGSYQAAELLNTLAVAGKYDHVRINQRTDVPEHCWVLAEQPGFPMNKTISVHFTPLSFSSLAHRQEWKSFLSQLIAIGAKVSNRADCNALESSVNSKHHEHLFK